MQKKKKKEKKNFLIYDLLHFHLSIKKTFEHKCCMWVTERQLLVPGSRLWRQKVNIPVPGADRSDTKFSDRQICGQTV